MNNYQLVKNTEWKEVELNGETREIPLEWDVKKLSELVKRSITKGTTPTTIGFDFLDRGEVKFFKVENFKKEKLRNTNIFISHECNNKMKRSQLEENDLLFSIAGVYIGKIAKVEKKDLPANVNQAIAIIRFNSSDDIEYSKFYITNYIEELTKNALSGVIPNFNLEMLQNVEIPYANEISKNKIADILSTQESIIQDIESLIYKYESRFQYLSEELLSGRLRVKELDGQTILYKNADDNWKEVEVNGEMKEIPMDWKIEPIKELLETHFAGEFGKEKNVSEHNVNVISLHVFAKTLKNSKSLLERSYENKNLKKILQHGDILIEKSGGSTDFPVGRLFFFQEKGLYGCVNFIQCLRFKAVNKHFIYNLLQKKYKEGWTREISGQTTGISNLKIPALLDTELVLPLLLEQDFIASIFEEQHELINQQKRFLIKEKQKFDWLLDNLLSGKYLVQNQ